MPRQTAIDEAGAWNALHARYTLHRINHEEAYSLGGEYERPTGKTVGTDRGGDGRRYAETRPPTPPTIGRHCRRRCPGEPAATTLEQLLVQRREARRPRYRHQQVPADPADQPFDLALVIPLTWTAAWGAQLIEAHVDEEVNWAVRHHQALCYFLDESVGYSYPEAYIRYF